MTKLSFSRPALAILVLAASSASFAAAPPAGHYKIDPVHSVAYFEVGHAGGVSRFMGRFDDIAGDLVVDAPEKSSIKVDVKVDSIDTRHEGLDKHLKSPDFFSAVQFPVLNFSSSAINFNAAGEGTVSGNLTLHGVTKPVTLRLRQIGTGSGPKGDTRVGYVAAGSIKRSDFGMGYGIPKAATDDVDLRINIEAIKQYDGAPIDRMPGAAAVDAC
jgi:polyisoprenoid-binding protein YceI